MLKKFFAECIGTFVLVFFACGTAALSFGSLAATSLAFGLVIVAMAYSIGRISGCHINPAVSLALLLQKKLTLKEFGVYVLAQVLGGLLGGISLFGLIALATGKTGTELFVTVGDASNYVIGYSGQLTFGNIVSSLLVEVVLTCVFVYVILNATDEEAGNAKLAGLIIGLTLTLVHLVGIGLTGTSVNPARSLATALGSLIFGNSATALGQVWIFIVGPLAGGALAALLFKFLHKGNN